MIEQRPNQPLVMFRWENSDDILSVERRKDLPITVFYGGNSSERAGSLLSGQTVSGLLKQAGYLHVETFDITPKTICTLPDRKTVGVAFMTLHGGFGEDGTLQGLLEMLNIPYTGCGVAASAISADKVLFSRFVRSLGYKTPNQIIVSNEEDIDSLDLDFPKVIKPANTGCSYGVFYVEDRTDLIKRAAFTRRFSDRMVIEDYIEGRELSIGIFENPHKRKPQVLPIVELILKRKIQDFETKYPGGEHLIETIIPAQLRTDIQDEIEATCADIFQQLNCRGYSRMDLKVTNSGTIYWLENNTNPGMISLEESDFPKMLSMGGIDLPDFVDLMVESALLNHLRKQKVAQEIPGEKEMVEYLGIRLAE